MDNKLRIISHLGKNPASTFTMHQLSTMLKIPYASFYRTALKMQDMIIKRRIGQAYQIELALTNPIVRSYLAIASEEEKKEFLAHHPILRKISQELSTDDVVVLFGSYAKGSETERSDIDLLIINSAGKKTISFGKYETLFNKRINPIFVTEKEFRQMLNDKGENLGKQALSNHIILNNPQRFWDIAFA